MEKRRIVSKKIILFMFMILMLFSFFINSFSSLDSFSIIFKNYYAKDCTYIQAFYDYGEGFAEKTSFFGSKGDDRGVYHFSCNSLEANHIKKFRIDFGIMDYSEGQRVAFDSVKIKIGKITVMDVSFEALLSDKFELHDLCKNNIMDHTFTVTGNDPYIVILDKSIQDLKIKLMIKAIIFTLAMFALCLWCEKIWGCFIGRLGWIKENCQNIYRWGRRGVTENKWIRRICILLLFVAYILIMYHNYIFGDYIFCIKDDSFYQVYAYIANLAQEMAEHKYDIYSFHIGLGHENLKSYFNIFYIIAACFGVGHVAEGIIFAQCLKVFCSLVLFYLYLKKLKFNDSVSIIGALCFTTAGSGIALGMFSAYTAITVFVAFLLYSFEVALEKNNWFFLVLPTLFSFLNLDYYFGTLYLMVLIGYALVRFYLIGLSGKVLVKNCFLIMGCLFLSVLLYSPMLYDSLKMILESDRIRTVSNTQSREGFPILLGIKELKVAMLRLFSPDILGEYGSKYKGNVNYMDDPILYSGLVMLLAVPYSFHTNKREKKCFIFLLSLMMLYVGVPFITYLSAGGTNYTFRMAGYAINVIFIFVAVHGLNNIYYSNIKTNRVKWVVILSCALLLYFLAFETYRIERDVAIAALFFLLVEGGVIWVIQSRADNRKIHCFILVTLCFVELLAMTEKNVNTSQVLSKTTVKNDYYNDAAIEILEWIREQENEAFYRVEKNFRSTSYNDALVQNYHGVKMYVGGANQSNSMAEFYETMDMPLSNNDPKWVVGFDGYPVMHSFVGVRYLITGTMDNSEYGYEFIKEIGGYKLYKNMYALPLGFMTHTVMDEEGFKQLPASRKRMGLLNTCVVKDNRYGIDEYQDQKDLPQGIFTQRVKLMNGENIVKWKRGGNFRVVKLTINCDSREKVLGNQGIGKTSMREGTIGVVDLIDIQTGENVARRQLSIKEGTQEYVLEFYGVNADELRVSFSDEELILGVDVEIVGYDADSYYQEMAEANQRCWKENFRISEFNEDYIKGDIQTEAAGYMVLTIPYSDKWKCLVNGVEREIERVDIDFSGIYLEQGEYDITLYYEQSDKYLLCFYAAVIVIFAVGLVVWNTRRREKNYDELD